MINTHREGGDKCCNFSNGLGRREQDGLYVDFAEKGLGANRPTRAKPFSAKST
jgi:hypothetical protein